MGRLAINLLTLLMICMISSADAGEGQFDKYGGWKGLKGEKKGYFYTKKIDGRWWIVTPEGNVFWSVGMYCVRFGGLPATGTGKRAYKDACIKKYGNEIKWSEATRYQLKQWGFNTIGDWSSESVYKRGNFVYVVGIDLPRKSKDVIPEGRYGYFPDVFSHEFRDSVKEAMKSKFKRQPYLVDDPWLLGYFLADEPSWYGSKQRRGSLVDDFIKLDSVRPGKIAWVDFVKVRYPSVQDLNKAWGTDFKNLDELLYVQKIDDNSITKKDKLAFLKVIAEEFARVLSQTLREFDKHHMILGTRPSRLYPEVIEGMSKYADIFSTSAYGLNQGYKIDQNFSKTIDEVYKYFGKPIMLGVLISAQDTGLPYGIVKTQRDRGVSYWRYLAKVASHPAIVGIHWFQYFDPPRKCYDKRAANWGLVNAQDEPYEEAVELISQANNMVYAYALGLSDFAPNFDGFLKIKKETAAEKQKRPLKKIAIPISNPGFEQGKSRWGLQTWKGRSKASIDSSVKHSGSKALKIQGGPDEGWGSVGVGVQYNPGFVLKPGYEYKLSAWIKTKDVEDMAFVRIKVKYKGGDVAYFRTGSLYGTDGWKYVETDFSPREENTVEYLGAQLVGRGTVWFDDVNLEVLE